MDEKLKRLKEIIFSSKSMVFFGGAGVSTESGIPDFRSEGGLYQARSNYGHSPETMLSHSFFMGHTNIFYDYYKNYLIHMNVKPNPAHIALARLEKEGKLKAIVTQNIDGLHQTAGSKVVYELHGSSLRNNCMNCNSFYDLAYIMEAFNCIDKNGNQGHIPYCKKCGNIVKPDVVLYEEPLDEDVISGAVEAISTCDTLIIGGTSLVVYPAAGLINYFNGDNLILINKQPTSYDSQADLVITAPIGQTLASLTAKSVTG